LPPTHPEESLGANPADAALNPADPVAMGVSTDAAGPGNKRGRFDLENGTFRALNHRAFRLLFTAFLINQTGFWISHLSLQGLMVELSGNDTRKNGLLFFALFVPAFILAPLAGVAADRYNRKTILLSCYAGIAVSSAALALMSFSGVMTWKLLLMMAGIMGTAFAFSGPSNFAIAANSVPARDLQSAVSLQSAANNLTRVVGPLLAAPALATGRYEISFLAFMSATIIAAILTASMKIAAYEIDTDQSGIWARIRAGFQHARARNPAMPALSVVAALSAFGVSHVVLLPAYAQDVLGRPEMFAWLVAATGIGAIAGALRTGRAGKVLTLREGALGLFAYGLFLVAFAQTDSIPLALIEQLFIGYFYFAVMTNLQTLIQQVVDESKRGRVMSLFQIAWAGLVPFGSLTMGYMAGPLGTPQTLLWAGLVCVAYGITIAALAPRWERDS
jgi:predicted MFS family arabinose efflux permease